MNLSLQTTWFYLLAIHCLNGGIAAVIAQYKGYNLLKWLVYGLIGGTFALVWSITLKKK